MPNDIDNLESAIKQTAAHEFGHAMFALLGGMSPVQIDIQIKRMGQPDALEVRGTNYHGTFEDEIDRAAGGIAGVIAQELYLHPDLRDPELYEQTINHPSLSASDRKYFDPLSSEIKKVAFDRAVQVVRSGLAHVVRQAGLLFDQIKERLGAGETGAGFLYSQHGLRLGMQVVQIRMDLFEPEG